MASVNWVKTTARREENIYVLECDAPYIRSLTVIIKTVMISSRNPLAIVKGFSSAVPGTTVTCSGTNGIFDWDGIGGDPPYQATCSHVSDLEFWVEINHQLESRTLINGTQYMNPVSKKKTQPYPLFVYLLMATIKISTQYLFNDVHHHTRLFV